MKKLLFAILSVALLNSCSNSVKGEDGSDQPEELINAPVDKNASLDDLKGIWEIVEVRKNPYVKGRKPNTFQFFTWFGLNENGRLVTAEDRQYIEDSFQDSSDPKVAMKDGWLVANNEDELRDKLWGMQWGKQGIAVIEVNDDRAIIAFNMGGGDLKRYQVMERRD